MERKNLSFFTRVRRYVRRKCKAACNFLHVYGADERKLLQYQNKYAGKRCFIIGNGPSLKTEDLELLQLKGEYSFACNKIYKIFEKTSWRPSFYACTDFMVFGQNASEILSLKGFPKFLGCNLPFQKQIRQEQENIILNYEVKKIEKTKFNPCATFICSGGSVVFVMITLAWMMGFRELYLIGCDHEYKFFDGKSGGETEVTDEVNQDYFTENYMRPGEVILIGDLKRAQQGYQLAKEYIEAHGGKIYNATHGGKLEVFPRADFYHVLEKGTRKD